MDYYRFYSFLNSLGDVLSSYNKIENEEARLAILGFAQELIRKFTEIYGLKKLPDDVRKRPRK